MTRSDAAVEWIAVHVGPLASVYALQNAAGKSQSLDYLAKQDPRSRQKMNSLLEMIDSYGRHYDPARYRHIEDSIWELKVNRPKAVRVLAYVPEPGRHILVHGFDKSSGSGKIPKRHLEAARERIAEWEKDGSRYEQD